MPNIEIFSLRSGEATTIRDGIKRLLAKEPFTVDVVITVHEQTETTDLNYERQPFLRLACDNQGHLDRTAELLRPLNLDIEVLPLIRFIKSAVPWRTKTS